MPRRFHTRIAHLKLLATAAAWRVALTDLHDQLTEVNAALRSFASSSKGVTHSDAGSAEALSETRCALESDLRILEAALADVQVRLRALEAP